MILISISVKFIAVDRIVQEMPTTCITNIQFTDKALINHVSKTVEVNTMEDCFTACLSCIQSRGGCMCLSFNIRRLTNVEQASAVRFMCEINDANNIIYPLDFVDRKGSQFYQVMWESRTFDVESQQYVNRSMSKDSGCTVNVLNVCKFWQSYFWFHHHR